jgi:hypothetical protein
LKKSTAAPAVATPLVIAMEVAKGELSVYLKAVVEVADGLSLTEKLKLDPLAWWRENKALPASCACGKNPALCSGYVGGLRARLLHHRLHHVGCPQLAIARHAGAVCAAVKKGIDLRAEVGHLKTSTKLAANKRRTAAMTAQLACRQEGEGQ